MKVLISIISIIVSFSVLLIIVEVYEPKIIVKHLVITGIITTIIALGLSYIINYLIEKKTPAGNSVYNQLLA